jgi:hypothetical protein
MFSLIIQKLSDASAIEYLNDVFGRKTDKVIEKEIDLYFKKLEENGFKGVLSVPFFNVKKQNITYLPFNINLMLTGSNGMAAGNSIAEGSFQGICELLERYAASLVFHEQLTPPTIPWEYVSQYSAEMKIINDVVANGYEVIVKDFSCNKKLPVIGVIIIDKETQKYRLNVGSDTSFPIALSRALTEIHQGVENKESFEKVLLSIPTKEQDYFLKTDKLSMLKRSIELKKFIINNGGVFPVTLFAKKESYKFNSDTFLPKDNYLQEVKSLIGLIKDLDQNIYMRDVSFLGFPSFYIYIPKLSPIGKKTTKYDNENVNLTVNVNTDLVEDLFFPFNQLIASKEKIKNLIDIISSPNQKEIKDIKMCKVLKIEFKPEFYWSSLLVSFFLTLFYFIIEEYTLAIESLTVFMEETNNKEDKYYNNVLHYFKLLEQGESQYNIKKAVPFEIITDFASSENIFSKIDIPNCPDCNNCALSENCLTKHKVNFSKRILLKMRETQVCQDPFKII